MQDLKSRKPPEVSGLAACDYQGADEATNLNVRINRYGVAKVRALEMVAHLNDEGNQHAALLSLRMRECGNYLEFRHYYTVGKVRLSKASFCMKHLLCPLCAIRRGAKALKAYLDRWQVVSEANKALKLYLVTLTVKNGDDLHERFAHLQASVKLLMQRRRIPRTVSEARKADGGVMSYEVTNRGKGWHPHVHMIWACAEEPSQERLQGEWHQITGDSYVVDVRPFRAGQDPAEGFSEVFKYAMKFSELSVADNWEAFQVLSGRRLVSSFGSFRGVVIPEALTDELLDDLPYIELMFRFFGGCYHFSQ